ncbi:hypothetical protein [Acetobacter sp. UBA5411]|uniref:hypothetical protein n=1 Tax=Acetobacter sp. UBA5411 TaxID=1945905 RepID=UPI0025BDC1F5|nr:hypothetical protein [Acetobacter sp. UBA5411]
MLLCRMQIGLAVDQNKLRLHEGLRNSRFVHLGSGDDPATKVLMTLVPAPMW